MRATYITRMTHVLTPTGLLRRIVRTLTAHAAPQAAPTPRAAAFNAEACGAHDLRNSEGYVTIEGEAVSFADIFAMWRDEVNVIAPLAQRSSKYAKRYRFALNVVQLYECVAFDAAVRLQQCNMSYNDAINAALDSVLAFYRKDMTTSTLMLQACECVALACFDYATMQ